MDVSKNLYYYRALVSRVVDGDTIIVNIDWGNSIWTHDEGVRFSRIDAYETKLRKGVSKKQKKKGLEAKEFVKKTIGDKEIIIKTSLKGKGKFGRILAEIYYKNGLGKWENLNDELVYMGYAIFQKY